jgi:hypothetical protein
MSCLLCVEYYRLVIRDDGGSTMLGICLDHLPQPGLSEAGVCNMAGGVIAQHATGNGQAHSGHDTTTAHHDRNHVDNHDVIHMILVVVVAVAVVHFVSDLK